jgi:hypothetical protein
VTRTYKYLGVLIDNDTTLRLETADIKKKEVKFTRLVNMSWARKLPPKLRFEAWNQLVNSRFMYAKDLLRKYSPHIRNTLKQLEYRLIKALLNVKVNVNTDNFLHQALGMNYERYAEMRQQHAHATLTSINEASFFQATTPILKTARDTLKQWTISGGTQLIKWRTNCAFMTVMTKTDKTTKKLICGCKNMISDAHVHSCSIAQKRVEEISAPMTFQ